MGMNYVLKEVQVDIDQQCQL